VTVAALIASAAHSGVERDDPIRAAFFVHLIKIAYNPRVTADQCVVYAASIPKHFLMLVHVAGRVP
jgi:hypothetical protein